MLALARRPCWCDIWPADSPCIACCSEYVKRFAKKTDAEDTAAKEGSDGTGSDGFLSSSDDEEDLPATGGGGGMT